MKPEKIKTVIVSIVSPSICHEVMGLDVMIFIFRMLSFKPAYGENVTIGEETSGVPPLRYILISSSQLHQVLEVALIACSMSSLKGHASLLIPFYTLP